MRSPFPGMDPYLEAHWRDVHARLVIHAAEALQERLPRDLRARVEERVFVEAPGEGSRALYPDVRVVERPRRAPPDRVGETADPRLATPLIVHVAEDEPLTETFVEIREAGAGGRLVTVLEVVSLSNKAAGPGRKLYRQKQEELRLAGVSLVEIDLLRSGGSTLMVDPESLPPGQRGTYAACVRRAWRPTALEFYAFSLRDPLPAITVPLRERDADVPLDLQALIDRVDSGGRYDDIDYRTDPLPPLHEKDAAWADALLRAAGLR